VMESLPNILAGASKILGRESLLRHIVRLEKS